jgi:hypothetical protein
MFIKSLAIRSRKFFDIFKEILDLIFDLNEGNLLYVIVNLDNSLFIVKVIDKSIFPVLV